MVKKYKVLWVEDETISKLMERKTHLEIVDDFDVTIVETATMAEKIIFEKGVDFDAIIIDVRLSPGYDPKWLRIYDKPEERLGVYLVNKVFKALPHLINRIGITTIERWKDIEPLFDVGGLLDPSVQYHPKVSLKSPEYFEAFIRELINKK